MDAVTPVENNQGVTTPPTTGTTTDTKGTKGEFESILRSLVSPDKENKVSEEELFAGLVGERLKAAKGDELANEYKTMLETKKNQLKKADGFVPFEDAAKAALRAIRDDGKLTKEEADKIYTEAFSAAQLDGNTDALYDSRGGKGDPTIAVELMESALTSAKALIEKITGSSEPAKLRSLDEASNTVPHGGASATPNTTLLTGSPTGVADKTSPQGTTMDGPNGFLFKPVSNNEGRLAVLLPEALAHYVSSLVLKDSDGKELEVGRSTGFGDNGSREKFSFSKRGADYGKNLMVEARLSDGTIKTWEIPDPSKRYD